MVKETSLKKIASATCLPGPYIAGCLDIPLSPKGYSYLSTICPDLSFRKYGHHMRVIKPESLDELRPSGQVLAHFLCVLQVTADSSSLH